MWCCRLFGEPGGAVSERVPRGRILRPLPVHAALAARRHHRWCRSRCRHLLLPRDTRIQVRAILSCSAFFRPRSEASEGYVFAGVCHSVTGKLYSGKQTDATAIDFQPIGDRLTNEKFSGVCLFTTMGGRYASYWNASLLIVRSNAFCKQSHEIKIIPSFSFGSSIPLLQLKFRYMKRSSPTVFLKSFDVNTPMLLYFLIVLNVLSTFLVV